MLETKGEKRKKILFHVTVIKFKYYITLGPYMTKHIREIFLVLLCILDHYPYFERSDLSEFKINSKATRNVGASTPSL